MSRLPVPPVGARPVPPGTLDAVTGAEGLEELGADAIIAQETEAHLPQKRVNVQDESRSVVISTATTESPPNVRAARAERFQATMLIRDRRQLAALRGKVLGGDSRGDRMLYVWAGLTVVAFAVGGLVSLLLVRSSAVQNVPEPNIPTAVKPPEPRRTGGGSKAPAQSPRAPVRVEDLPLQTRAEH